MKPASPAPFALESRRADWIVVAALPLLLLVAACATTKPESFNHAAEKAAPTVAAK